MSWAMATFLVTLNQLSQSVWPVRMIGTLETVTCEAMLQTVEDWASNDGVTDLCGDSDTLTAGSKVRRREYDQ